MGTVTAISRGGVTLMIPLVLSCVVQSERVVSESETGVPSAAMVAEQSPLVDPKRFEGVDSVTVGRKVDHLTDTLTSVSRDGRFEAAATRQRDSNAPIVVVGERMRSGSSSRVGLIELAEWEAFPSMRWIARARIWSVTASLPFVLSFTRRAPSASSVSSDVHETKNSANSRAPVMRALSRW